MQSAEGPTMQSGGREWPARVRAQVRAGVQHSRASGDYAAMCRRNRQQSRKADGCAAGRGEAPPGLGENRRAGAGPRANGPHSRHSNDCAAMCGANRYTAESRSGRLCSGKGRGSGPGRDLAKMREARGRPRARGQPHSRASGDYAAMCRGNRQQSREASDCAEEEARTWQKSWGLRESRNQSTVGRGATMQYRVRAGCTAQSHVARLCSTE